MKKKIRISFLVLMIIITINFVVAKIFKFEFIEVAFFIGLISTIFIGFFSSEGVPTTYIQCI